MRPSNSTVISQGSTYFYGKRYVIFEEYKYVTFPSTTVLAKHFHSEKHLNFSTLFYVLLWSALLGSYTMQLAFRRNLMLPSTGVKLYKKHWNSDPLKIKLLCSFETSEDTHRAAQSHVPEDPNALCLPW